MKKKTTIYDIAKELGITVSTVSRALSGFPAISKNTRQAVLDAAKRLNYSPNKLASALKSGKTFIVGVIVPSVESHFFASIIHSIEEGLKSNGYRIILFQSKELLANEIKGVKTLLEAQVDGIMASMSLETNEIMHFEEIVKQNKPLIIFDRVNLKIDVPTITLNDYQAGYLATEHLIKQGYRNIAFIAPVQQIKIFSNRLKGYKDALQKNGLVVDSNNIIFSGLSINDGLNGAMELLSNPNKPDAIIAGDDFTALGVTKKLNELGQHIPKIGVIGFANEAFSAYISPSLSTIDQHPAQMGSACAAMFLEMILQQNPYDNIRNIILEPTLLPRASTGLN
ncbi:LacI family DNA-binding transcriptional regulator [Pedobacter lithocola]|uniref:LacI family DNA-binding transcriptional regulator n=1 Tax=Pedobacter lithocola TaxID=1908239 RepID=A0ABV8P4A7_9SPHI